MINLTFDNVEEILMQYSKNNLKPLSKCKETLDLYTKENIRDDYRVLAKKFKKFNEGYVDDTSDYYFYKYLKSLNDQMHYVFPLKKGGYIKVEVDLLHPYDYELKDIVNPKWHLIVAYYAYKDAAFNHEDDENAAKITGINKYLRKKFRCSTLRRWMEEVLI